MLEWAFILLKINLPNQLILYEEFLAFFYNVVQLPFYP